jgi:hypothetical protein
MNNRLLIDIKNLPQNAVFGVISDFRREFYISHTSNLRTRIGLIIDDIELYEDSRLVVFLDGVEDRKYKQMFAQYYVDKFISDGYKNVSRNRCSYINYRVKVQYSSLFNSALVLLVNKRNDKIIVGSFKTVEEANEYVTEYYKEGTLVQPIYATNKVI